MIKTNVTRVRIAKPARMVAVFNKKYESSKLHASIPPRDNI